MNKRTFALQGRHFQRSDVSHIPLILEGLNMEALVGSTVHDVGFWVIINKTLILVWK